MRRKSLCCFDVTLSLLVWLCYHAYFVLPIMLSVGKELNISNADWMSRLPSSLHDFRIFDLAIPGSHDSGSYSLQPESYNYFDRDKFTKYFKMALNGTKKAFVGDIIYKWSKTQDRNITEQLNLGVRYLDLRITVDPTGKCLIVHRLLGTNLSGILQQIDNFLQLHPKEIVLLDFNHIYYDHSSTDRAAKNVIEKLAKEIFTNKLCPVSMVFYAKLKAYWKRKCQVLIFYGTANIPNNRFNRHYPNGIILSPFNEMAFTQKTTWLKFLDWNYLHGHPYGKLYVTQGIMEPHWMEIIIAGVSEKATLKDWISDDASTELVKWLRHKHNGRNGINIVIADFVENHEFVETVLALNNSAIRNSRNSLILQLLLLLVTILLTL